MLPENETFVVALHGQPLAVTVTLRIAHAVPLDRFVTVAAALSEGDVQCCRVFQRDQHSRRDVARPFSPSDRQMVMTLNCVGVSRSTQREVDLEMNKIRTASFYIAIRNSPSGSSYS